MRLNLVALKGQYNIHNLKSDFPEEQDMRQSVIVGIAWTGPLFM